MTTVALGDVCEVTTGQSAPQDADAFGSSGTPFVRAGSLERLCAGDSEDSLELIAPDKAQRYRLKLYPANTVVFPKSGMSAKVGRVHRLRKDCHLVSHLAAVLPSEKVDPTFLHRWFEYSPPSCLIENDAYPSIKTSTLEKIRIPLLPLSKQRRIAAILDKADALRAKRREAITKLDQLLQSVFLDMFGDHVGEPRSWPVITLGKALSQAEVFTDGDWVESKDQDPNGDVRLIQLADVGDGTYVDKSQRFLTREKALKLRCTFLQQNDILVARMPDPLGRACIFPGDRRESVTVVDVCVIRPSETGPDRRWLCACLNSDGVRNQIARMATGTTRSRISRGNLSKVELALPPLALQESFDRIAQVIERQKHALQRGSDQLDILFASLQHRAFTDTL